MEKIKAFFRKVAGLAAKAWGWIRVDGLLHIETSFIIAVVLAAVVNLFAPMWVAGAVGILVSGASGLCKEWYDYRHQDKHSAEWHDLVCDLIGLALAALVIIML